MRELKIDANDGKSEDRRRASGYTSGGKRDARPCVENKPHRWITGDSYIARYYPEVWAELGGEPSPLGWEYQYCLNCGRAVQVRLNGDGDGDGDTLEAGEIYNPDVPATSYREPGWVSTTIAASRLNVTCATVRNWIADPRNDIEAEFRTVRGHRIAVVSERWIERRLDRAADPDYSDYLIDQAIELIDTPGPAFDAAIERATNDLEGL